jgi:hypothetical protein
MPREYVYTVKIHEIDPDTGNVTLLFEEEEGLDGFAVTIPKERLQQMLENNTFDEWAQERIEERIKLLEEVRVKEEIKKKEKENVKQLEERLKGKKIKPKQRGGGR